MGNIADEVAALEQQAAAFAVELAALRGVADRVDSTLDIRLEELQSVGAEILNLHWELDNQLAEFDCMAIQESVARLQGLVCPEGLLPLIDNVVLLTAIRDDLPVPDMTLPDLHTIADDAVDHQYPRLTQDDLDQRFKTELDRAEQQWTERWAGHDWADDAERDDHRVQELAEAEQEAVRERARRAGEHLEEFFEHIGEGAYK